MDSITIRVNEDLSREIDDAIIPYYSTKTEFIREAIRDKLKSLRKDKLMIELKKHFGKVKTKTAYAQERMIREDAGNEFMKN